VVEVNGVAHSLEANGSSSPLRVRQEVELPTGPGPEVTGPVARSAMLLEAVRDSEPGADAPGQGEAPYGSPGDRALARPPAGWRTRAL